MSENEDKLLDVAPGLHTMRDMPLPSYFGG